MDPVAGAFYGGGFSLAPTYSAMTPPSTPSTSGGQRTQNININQKLDLMLSMFIEQKKTADETKATTDALQKHVLSLSTEVTEVKAKVESMSSVSTPSAGGIRKKIPPQLSVSILVCVHENFFNGCIFSHQ